jgi:hypothetical protein
VSRTAARVALVAGAIVMATISAEAVLRAAVTRLPVPFLIYLSPNIKDRTPQTWEIVRTWLPTLKIRREDSDAGWTFMPDLALTGTNEDGESYAAKTSAEGFFTPDLPDPKTPQIVTLGDSFLSTFYARRPMQNVMRDDLHVPVYNLAAGGWGPENYRAAYDKFARGRNHQLVIVFTFLNDITDVLNWNTWKTEETGESFLTWIQRTSAADGSMNRGESWFDVHSVLWNLAKFSAARRPARAHGEPEPSSPATLAADAAHVEAFGSGTNGFRLQFTRGMVFMDHPSASFFPGGSYYQYMQAYFESLDRLRASIAAAHARMVLVWIPSKERVYLPLLPAARRAAYVDPREAIDGIETAVARFAAVDGVSLLDLTEPLSTRAQAGEKLYFTVDGHLNSRGNEVAGHVVSEYLQHLPDASAPDHSGPPVYFRRGSVAAARALRLTDAVDRAGLVEALPSGWRVHGTATSRFGYLAQWRATPIAAPQWLVVRGRVRHGGLSVGLLKDGKWAYQMNITARGQFDAALPVTQSGDYAAVVANNLSGESLENDVDVAWFGLTPIE